jgi:orotate phosphoribosyltransferase
MAPAASDPRAALRSILLKDAYIRSSEPIRLSSGKTTNVYFDGKQVTLFPEAAVLFARAVLDAVDLTRIDAVGGMSIGADPAVSAISLVAYLEKKLRVPAFLVRKEPKPHGLQKLIEGVALKKGMRVLIVDDVITQGGAVLQAIRAAEDAGAKVVQVACLVDREEGGTDKLRSAGYPVYSVFKKSELE